MPYSKIPSEILCEIFLLLCNKPISLHVLDNSSCFDEFPWAVGQVCKRWREAFLSYPHLWTSLSLRYHSTDNLGVDYFHEMSRRTLLYLERSKQLPLTTTVRTTYYDSISRSVEIFPRMTWKLLLSCSERWERADLELCHEPPVLDLLRCTMPIIKSLRLRAYASHFKLYHPFAAAPRLTEVDLPGLLAIGGRVFPWSQLTKFKISQTNNVYIQIEKLEKFYHNCKTSRSCAWAQSTSGLGAMISTSALSGLRPSGCLQSKYILLNS